MQKSVEYLGYQLTADGIDPQPKKIEAMKRVLPPQNSKQHGKYPLAKESGQTPTSVSASYLQELSKGNRADQKSFIFLKDRVREDVPELYGLINSPANYNPRDFFPSKVGLNSQQAFGKNNPLKSYTVLPVLSQIVGIEWKLGCLSKDDCEPIALVKILPCREITLSMISNLARVDFSTLKLQPFDYDIYYDPEEKKKIIANKKVMRNACLIHYAMDLSTVQQYCNGKWTGEHQRTDQMVQVMSRILPDKLFQELAARLVDGVPNLLNTELPSEEVANLLSTNNLPTVVKNPQLVNKAIFKEECNHLSMVFSKHLAYFTPNLGIIKLGSLDKKHKKPRMYRHDSFLSESSTNLINKLVDCELSEPAIGYTMVLKHHAAFLWRTTATYSGCTIDLYNDVSGTLPQCTHHLDIACGKISLHENKMIVNVALHFGGNYGPASWKQPARARCFLAQWMYLHTHYQEALNEEALNLMDLPDEDDDAEACTIKPQFNKCNGTVKNEKGGFVPEYRIFVDNLLSTISRHQKITQYFIASSIESVYIILGYLGTITKPYLPPTMSWDKMVGRAVSPVCLSLGVEFFNRDLGITVDDYKVARLLKLLNTEWSRDRRNFQALPVAVLIGNVYAATLMCLWLRWSLHQLIGAMKELIKRNYNRLARTSHFDELYDKREDQWLDLKSVEFV